MRVDDEHGFVDAFERLRGLLWSPDVRQEQDPAHDQVIIESFIPGREFAVEGLLTDGRLTVLAIFDKPDPLDGPFFEETIYVTPSRESPDVQKAIAFHVEAAARAIGLHHGPLHAECRVNSSGVYVLEVAARPIGGLCSRALRFVGSAGAQASLEEVLLRHALGEDVATFRREALASGVMMIPIPRQGLYKTVEGVDDALSVPGVTEIRIAAKPDTRLVPLPEGRSYLGFIFARAVDAAADRELVARCACATAVRDRAGDRNRPGVGTVIATQLPSNPATHQSYLACCGTYPGGNAALSPKKKSSSCFEMSS